MGVVVSVMADTLADTPRWYVLGSCPEYPYQVTRTMASIFDTIGDGLSNAFLMAWQVWWALVLGFAISAIVQAWVPKARIESAMGGDGFAPVAKATALGAASSSCSYA